ncbi:MAG: hypothetical protein ABI776_06480 [Nocardioidaceae bacterium]
MTAAGPDPRRALPHPARTHPARTLAVGPVPVRSARPVVSVVAVHCHRLVVVEGGGSQR